MINLKDVENFLPMPQVKSPKQEEKCSCRKRDRYKCANESDSGYGKICLKDK